GQQQPRPKPWLLNKAKKGVTLRGIHLEVSMLRAYRFRRCVNQRCRRAPRAWTYSAVLAFALSIVCADAAAQAEDDRVLMAIFAHPDDEGLVGPILSRYAREGAEVILVTATDGREGTNEFSD